MKAGAWKSASYSVHTGEVRRYRVLRCRARWWKWGTPHDSWRQDEGGSWALLMHKS